MKTKTWFRILNTTIAIGAVVAIIAWGSPLILIWAGAWQCGDWTTKLLKRANEFTDKLIDNENSDNSTR